MTRFKFIVDTFVNILQKDGEDRQIIANNYFLQISRINEVLHARLMNAFSQEAFRRKGKETESRKKGSSVPMLHVYVPNFFVDDQPIKSVWNDSYHNLEHENKGRE